MQQGINASSKDAVRSIQTPHLSRFLAHTNLRLGCFQSRDVGHSMLPRSDLAGLARMSSQRRVPCCAMQFIQQSNVAIVA
mmetsp:Transcript_63754/g.151992  ORF Transcript_63754/g.151992 Transcript_63754/m.151992 type:complete len:80 (-) Transcript_63754:990-1229(-)